MAEAIGDMYLYNRIDYSKVVITDGFDAPQIQPAVELSKSGISGLNRVSANRKPGAPLVLKRIYVLFYNGTAHCVMYSDWAGVLSDEEATF